MQAADIQAADPPAAARAPRRSSLPALLRGLLVAAGLLASPTLLPAAGLPGTGIFEDVSARVGLTFVHFNGMTGEHYFPEMTGQGGALLDYDGDGDLDLYLVQGAMLGPGETLADALFPPQGTDHPTDRLLRNDLARGSGDALLPRFVDVTAASGLAAEGYGMGAAVGDFDNDGFPDLYLANYGPNQLYRNRGDGTFQEVTAASGTDDPRWSIAATFFDYDRDGWLDLYVVNYVDFDVAENPRCFAESSRRDYCGPSAFPPQGDRLFHNRGDGTFQEVTVRAGVAGQQGAGLGVVAADFDGDGWTDLYVTNDGSPNFLWLNQGDGTFQDEALLAGVAVNRQGQPEASMGVDAGDFDGDGDEDLFMAHLNGETNTLYVNLGGGLFEDRTIETGLAPPSLPFTSFGTGWVDVDNDGWLDLPVVSGAVRIIEALAREGDPFPLEQSNQLFLNLAGQRFEDATRQAGETFALAEVSRGLAWGDVDQDGDSDLVLFNNNGPARLLLNQVGQERPWIGLRLIAEPLGGRDVYGARVRVQRPGRAAPLWRRVAADGSYASARDPRLVVGLGDARQVEAVDVHWPGGRVQRLVAPPLERYLLMPQGPEPPPARPRKP